MLTVDLDVFVSVHTAEWKRLETLVRRRRRLTGEEADELVDLYERVNTHLSVVQSTLPDPALVTKLSTLVARARSAITGAHTPAWRDVARFVFVVFPAVTYRYRWWWFLTSVGCVLVSVVVASWLVTHPNLLTEIAPPQQLEQYANDDFEAYYGENPASSFASAVWTNNVWVSAQALAFGILLAVPTAIVLVSNMVSLGVSAAIMFTYGKGALFFGLITPHGLLELSAVFLAGAAGLKLGWSIIDPGPRRRLEALASEGRSAVSIALGLVGVLLISGVIEAFVTPSTLPTWARVAIGVVAEVAFLGYVFVFGRRAVAAGETGDVLPEHREDVLPSAG